MNKRLHITIREFPRLIGKVVATEPGEYAQLRYKALERIKEKRFKLNNGNFHSTMIKNNYPDLGRVIFSGELII